MLLRPIRWENNTIVFIDQTELPVRLKYLRCGDIDRLCKAIKKLRIRGAPLIGVAAALGYAMAAINSKAGTLKGIERDLREAYLKLKKTRPTAVNLSWALDRMQDAFLSFSKPGGGIIKGAIAGNIKKAILKEALSILNEDRRMCRGIGKNGAMLIKDGDIILTHCNAGMLATAGYGTALSIFYEAKKQGKQFKVYADETRPLMQG